MHNIGQRFLAFSQPFDAARNPDASPLCRAQMQRYLNALNNFDLWALKSKLNNNNNTIYPFSQMIFDLRYDATGNQPKLSEFESLPTSTGQESDASQSQSTSQQPHCDRQTRDDMNCQSAKSNESNNQVLKLQTDTHTHADEATCACMHMHVVCG